mgnify:CR=1 FL=1
MILSRRHVAATSLRTLNPRRVAALSPLIPADSEIRVLKVGFCYGAEDTPPSALRTLTPRRVAAFPPLILAFIPLVTDVL